MITEHKSIVVSKGIPYMNHWFGLVHKRTRAGHNGKHIMCPHCEDKKRVYHFSWTAIKCLNCDTWVDKYDYLVDYLDTWRSPR